MRTSLIRGSSNGRRRWMDLDGDPRRLALEEWLTRFVAS